jgi:hypothetical protein
MPYFQLGPANDQPYSTVVVSATTTTIAAVAALTAQTTRVYKLFLVASTATTLGFSDGSTALCGGLSLAANGSVTLGADGTPWFQTSANSAFNITNSAGAQVSGTVYYTTNKWFP